MTLRNLYDQDIILAKNNPQVLSLDMDFSSAMPLPWYMPQNKSNSINSKNVSCNFGGIIDNGNVFP